MKLDRAFLKALGVSDEAADQICNAHQDTLERMKNELAEAKKQLGEAQARKAAPRDSGQQGAETGEDSEAKKVRAEFDAYKAEVEKAEAERRKTAALRDLLKGIGVAEKRIDSVLKVTDLSGIELDENGKIVNAAELRKAMKAEWADFIVSEETRGADTATPPASTGGKMTLAQIMAITDDEERQRAIAQNHEMFGF